MSSARPTAPDIVTPEAVVLDLELAGIASRGLARVLDTLIQGVIIVLVALAAALSVFSGGGWVAIAVLVVFIALIVFGYPVLFELLWSGRTPGKAALGLRVVSEDGAPLSGTGAFARSAMQLVDFVIVPGGLLAILAALFSRRNQRLGDMVAGTVVLRERTATGLTHAVAFPAPPGWEAYVSSLDVARLSVDQYQVIRAFLLRVADLSPDARHAMAARLARPAAAVLGHTPPPGVPPELFLVCVASGYQRRHGLVQPGYGQQVASQPVYPAAGVAPGGVQPWASTAPPPPPPPPVGSRPFRRS